MWALDGRYLVVTGFSRQSERQVRRRGADRLSYVTCRSPSMPPRTSAGCTRRPWMCPHQFWYSCSCFSSCSCSCFCFKTLACPTPAHSSLTYSTAHRCPTMTRTAPPCSSLVRARPRCTASSLPRTAPTCSYSPPTSAPGDPTHLLNFVCCNFFSWAYPSLPQPLPRPGLHPAQERPECARGGVCQRLQADHQPY